MKGQFILGNVVNLSRAITVCLIVAFCTWPAMCCAESVLLGVIPTVMSCGGGTYSPNPPKITLELKLDNSVSGIGSNIWLSNGSSGSFDFNSTNDTKFTEIASALTNGSDDYLAKEINIFDGSGCAQLGYESNFFNPVVDLKGANINFIRRVVNSVNLTLTSGQPFNWVDDSIDARWEIWGTRAAVAGDGGTPVPVMEGWWILPGMLAGALMMVRRRNE